MKRRQKTFPKTRFTFDEFRIKKPNRNNEREKDFEKVSLRHSIADIVIASTHDNKGNHTDTRIISYKERAIRNGFRGRVQLKENSTNDGPNLRKIKEHFS